MMSPKDERGRLAREEAEAWSTSTTAAQPASSARKPKPSASVLLETPGALLSRSHLRELGLERRAVDSVFRELEVVVLPGYSRPLVRVEDYLELIARSTYGVGRVRA